MWTRTRFSKRLLLTACALLLVGGLATAFAFAGVPSATWSTGALASHDGGSSDAGSSLSVADPVGCDCEKADVKKVSFEVVNAPTDIDVSTDVNVTLRSVIRNNGPYGPVDIEDKISVKQTPTDCDVTPLSYTQVVEHVAANTQVTVDKVFTIHCNKPSTHKFVFKDEAKLKPCDSLCVEDPDSSNNSATTDLTVNAWAKADAKIVNQWVEGCDDLNGNKVCDLGEPTHPAPSEIPVSQDVPILVKETIHNNGPYGPLELETVGTPTASPDCTITPASHTEQFHNVAVGVDVTHNEPFTIHCNKPSEHTFTFDNVISINEPHITDSNSGNNTAHTAWTVSAIAQADLQVVAQRTVVWPTDIDVSQNVLVTLETDVKNNGPYGSVEALFEGRLSPPTGCTAVPARISQQVVLAAGESKTVQQQFTIHCSQKCLHTFTFYNSITAKDPHVRDSQPANNTRSRILSIHSWAQADAKIVSQSFVGAPAEIPVSTNVDVTLRKTLHNNGPYGPVDVSISASAVAPADCTATAKAGNPTSARLPVSSAVVVDEVWTIRCDKPSSHSFTFNNSIVVTGVHVEDPTPGNNSASTGLTVAVLVEADVKVVGQQLVNPPASIPVSTPVDVTLRKTLHNNGPYSPVAVSISASATAPPDCTAAPKPGNPTSANLPVSTDVVVDEVWTIRCAKPSSHSFTFNNAIATTTLHVVDPTPGNNAVQTGLSVNALAQVDVAVTQTIVSPPTEIDVSSNVVITLQKTLTATVLNLPPYNIPSVTVTVTKTASAPAGCTVAPVPPIAVDKVVPTTGSLVYTETFTIHCSEPSTHGPFTFTDTVSGPTDAHISDPNAGNNTASSSLTVDAIGHADMKVVAQYVEDPPAEIAPSEDVPILLKKVIHNDGPWGPVEAVTTTTVTAPAYCTVDPVVHTQQFDNLPVGVDIIHNEPFTIHCSKLGTYTFTFADTVGLKEPHMHDPVPGNNSWSTPLTVNSVAEADVKIVSVGFVDWPTKLPLGENLDVTLLKHVHNNGPWAPVDIAITATATAPLGCTVVPKSVPSSISAVPVSIDQVVTEVWTIRCTSTGLKTFDFDNSITVATPFVSDSNLANNSSHNPLSVMDDLDSGADSDGDGVLNGGDNCALSYNPGQEDCSNNDVGDACDTGDFDVDVFSDAVEVYLGTDPADACPDDRTDDAWPLDQDKNKQITVSGDVLKYRGKISLLITTDPATWSLARLDLDANHLISVSGDVLKYRGKIGRSCE